MKAFLSIVVLFVVCLSVGCDTSKPHEPKAPAVKSAGCDCEKCKCDSGCDCCAPKDLVEGTLTFDITDCTVIKLDGKEVKLVDVDLDKVRVLSVKLNKKGKALELVLEVIEDEKS